MQLDQVKLTLNIKKLRTKDKKQFIKVSKNLMGIIGLNNPDLFYCKLK